MAKKRINKIEENYNKFSSMTPEQLGEYRNGLEEEINEIEAHIENKQKELEGRQASIDITVDLDKKDVLIAQKETAEQEMKDLEVMKSKKTKEIRDIENWARNKDKVDKIIGYKKRLTSQKTKLMEEVDFHKGTIETLKEEKEDVEKQLTNSEELDNNEYNDLMRRKIEAEKEIEVQEKFIKETEHKIANLTGSISKCDLAWKNLMMGKSWDEIHVKAIKMNEKNGKYTRQKNVSDKAHDVDVFDVIKGKNIETTQVIDSKDLTEYDEFANKHPRLAKIRDWFKNRFSRPNKETTVLDLIGSKTEKPTISSEAETEEKTQRDAFIEQLRMMTDEEYKKQVRGKKEAEYIEMHKAKTEEEKDDKEKER